jgi:amino acid transporter
VAIGEIVTLPLVVLISFIAQPRLQFAMAQDGLLPKVMAFAMFNYLCNDSFKELL